MAIRVLVLTKSLGVGGAERLIVTSVRNGDREAFGYQVAFVRSSERALVPELERAGVPVHDLGCPGDWDLRWMLRLRALLLRERFDVLHAHLPYAAALGRLVVASLPEHCRPRLVSTQHGAWRQTAMPVRAINRATVGLDAAVVAVSPATFDTLPRSVREKGEVIVHGIERTQLPRWPSTRSETRAELGIAPSDALVLCVSRLRPEKGIDVLLRAAHDLATGGRTISFAVAGDGPEQRDLTALRDRLGLRSTFAFLGARGDTLRLMAGADLLVLPSRSEGLPVVLMEALAVGVPVVACAVGGVTEALAGGRAGAVVPPERPDLLAAAIDRLLGDPAELVRLAAAGWDAGHRYDAASSTRRIEDRYRSLAGAR